MRWWTRAWVRAATWKNRRQKEATSIQKQQSSASFKRDRFNCAMNIGLRVGVVSSPFFSGEFSCFLFAHDCCCAWSRFEIYGWFIFQSTHHFLSLMIISSSSKMSHFYDAIQQSWELQCVELFSWEIITISCRTALKQEKFNLFNFTFIVPDVSETEKLNFFVVMLWKLLWQKTRWIFHSEGNMGKYVKKNLRNAHTSANIWLFLEKIL